MKNPRHAILVALTVLAVFLTLGVFGFRNLPGEEIRISPAPSFAVMPTGDHVVNINTADHQALTTLPGIGDVLAQRIIDHREENGLFRTVEELMNVKGIGEKRMEQILDLVTIGG